MPGWLARAALALATGEPLNMDDPGKTCLDVHRDVAEIAGESRGGVLVCGENGEALVVYGPWGAIIIVGGERAGEDALAGVRATKATIYVVVE